MSTIPALGVAHESRTPDALARTYEEVRQASVALIEGLSPEDCVVQSMPLASPVKWHLAHTSWFFETFILAQGTRGFRPFDADFRLLFNSYYHTVGEQFPGPNRGLLTRPSLDRVLAYRRHVDDGIRESFAAPERLRDGIDFERLIEVGIRHEQQHQELLVTDVKHLLSLNPTHPVYRDRQVRPIGEPAPPGWVSFDEGIYRIGHEGPGFCFDNERPNHRTFLHAFRLASRPVIQAEYVEFIEAGGYRTPALWLADGWETVCREGWQHPAYWLRRDERWHTFTTAGLRVLQPDEPVCHVSYLEAEAYARWRGFRLATEAEWEVAAAALPIEGNLAESGLFHPVPPTGDGSELEQIFGNVWEWTSSPYVAYPGYRPPAGALGEYNAKFMCKQFVLRGGSCATPISQIRKSYRNFFYPEARWQFSGIRLAQDGA